MVAKRKGVSRLIPKKISTSEDVPSRSAAEGTRKVAHKKEGLFRVLWVSGLLKPTGNVGQHQKDSLHFVYRQADKVEQID
ncbi:hypothetical protein ACT4_021_02190 [Acinetobacter sp. NBRC 100985]|nr:hypothetical protein [Acinetobacter sp.]GAB01603.1 hypothetical protein ACT4_021_02190 [Acinetobacter sp. NBRC 100985]HIQ33549.1 hypothetical protein [Acinetobacter venetianus]